MMTRSHRQHCAHGPKTNIKLSGHVLAFPINSYLKIYNLGGTQVSLVTLINMGVFTLSRLLFIPHNSDIIIIVNNKTLFH